jgi:hypothetical protein
MMVLAVATVVVAGMAVESRARALIGDCYAACLRTFVTIGRYPHRS